MLHEAIRQHSVKAAEQVKLYGKKNDLLERIKADDTFGLSEEEIEMLMQPETFTGMAEHQCEKFLTLYGKKNDLLERIKADDTFGLSEEEIEMLMQPETFTGMAEHQCEKFLTEVVAPVLEQCKEEPSVAADINV